MTGLALVNDFMGVDAAECDRCGRDSCAGDCGAIPSVPNPETRTLEPGTKRRAGVGRAQAYSLAELRLVTFPRRRPLLTRQGVPVIRSGNIAEVYAMRGIGKTWFLLTLALVTASNVEALGFSALNPSRVLLIDGEMSSEELQERLAYLCDLLKVGPDLPLRIIGADWQGEPLGRLDTPTGQAAVEAEVEGADLIIMDNRSCLFDPESEKDPSAWTPAQEWLLSLRRRGKAVILAHHSNRQGGARGHSKPEDVMDVLIKLTRPDGYSQEQGARFLLEWEKARGIHGSAVAPFVGTLGPEGWTVESTSDAQTDSVERKLIDYIALVEKVGEKPSTASKAVSGAGVNKSAGLRAFDRLLKTGRIVNRDGYGLA